MNSVMKSFGSAVILLMLTAGVLGLAYARWTHAVADADAALANGDLKHALADYAAAEARFDALPAARQLFAAEYNRVVGNELWVLYQLGRFDETIDKAEKAPDAASPHFFSACAFFEKGSLEPKPEARLGWFSRAEDEFRRAVEAAPGRLGHEVRLRAHHAADRRAAQAAQGAAQAADAAAASAHPDRQAPEASGLRRPGPCDS